MLNNTPFMSELFWRGYNGLYARLQKCAFDQVSQEFLDFILFLEGITMDLHKLQAVHGWAAPHNIYDLQCFLGLANFY